LIFFLLMKGLHLYRINNFNSLKICNVTVGNLLKILNNEQFFKFDYVKCNLKFLKLSNVYRVILVFEQNIICFNHQNIKRHFLLRYYILVIRNFLS